jgi:hypothetical protein
MTYPKPSEKPRYENDTLSFSVDVRTDGIAFEIYNKTDEGIKIEWDEVSISLNGASYRVIHLVRSENTYTNISTVQPPATIPPKSFLKDKLIPVKNISTFVYKGKPYAVLNEMFPKYDYGNKKTRDLVMSRLGQKLTIYFPFYMNNKMVSSYYNLVVKNIYKK